MAFITASGLTEAGTSHTIQTGGMTVHYHDIGSGEPVIFLHSYGPGTTVWITFYKVIDALSQHFRCVLMDMPNFRKTGPIVYHEGVHAVQTRTAVALMDALNIPRAHFVGNSQGGQSSMVVAMKYPERLNKFVMGAYRKIKRPFASPSASSLAPPPGSAPRARPRRPTGGEGDATAEKGRFLNNRSTRCLRLCHRQTNSGAMGENSMSDV